MKLHMDKRFHNLTRDQVYTLDKVLTEIIPIHGRGNFPTLEVRAKDMIRMMKDRLLEREIQVHDIRLNGSTASHVMVKDNGLDNRDLDIIFRLELPRQEDFQVIKEVVLSTLRDLLPSGVNRRKITFLTMREAYVQKMVKVFNEHDRWSLISLSNNRGNTMGLRFVSSQRRQFEFSVDSFQIILDRMLESYWEAETKQDSQSKRLCGKTLGNVDTGEEKHVTQQSDNSQNQKEADKIDSVMGASAISPHQSERTSVPEAVAPEPSCSESVYGEHEPKLETEPVKQTQDKLKGVETVDSEEDAELSTGKTEDKENGRLKNAGHFSSLKTLLVEATEPLVSNICLNLQCYDEKLVEADTFKQPPTISKQQFRQKEISQCLAVTQFKAHPSIPDASSPQASHLELSCPPPAKKTCSTSKDIVPEYCPSPNLPRKMSRKLSSVILVPEKLSLLTDLSNLQPIDMLKTIQANVPLRDEDRVHNSDPVSSRANISECVGADTHTSPTHYHTFPHQHENSSTQTIEHIVDPNLAKLVPDSNATQESRNQEDNVLKPKLVGQESISAETDKDSVALNSGQSLVGENLGPGSGQDPVGDNLELGSELGQVSDTIRLDSGLGPIGDSIGLGSGLGPVSDRIRFDLGLDPVGDSITLGSELDPVCDGMTLDSGLDPVGDSITLDSGLDTVGDSITLRSELVPDCDGMTLDSGLDPVGDSITLRSELVPVCDGMTLDSGLDPVGDSIPLDSGLGPVSDSIKLGSGLGPAQESMGSNSDLDLQAGLAPLAENPTITVEAECMYGDFEEAIKHLHFRLIATHSPEEIRGGGLLRYSDLLVRNFRPASETEIKSLERYMCSRFFIDYPDVNEQRHKIESYIHCHFVGNAELNKYDFLMTLRRVINESTVCLMGHERRQTLNMITVLALRVLGEQNAIPNTANVTCFYQPAPYVADPVFHSYYIAQAQPPLVFHPYPLQVHMQTGPV